MKWLWSLLTATVLLASTPAWALDPCPDNGGTAFLVNTPIEAGSISGGYNNPACDLIITASVDPTVVNWKVSAKSFRLTGASVINQLNLSAITITSVGDITLQVGVLKAREDLNLRCLTPGCEISSTPGSILIASESLDPFVIPGDPGSGFATKGKLSITGLGPVNLAVASIFGGSRIQITAPSVLVKTDPSGGGTCPCPSLFSGGGGQEVRLTATAPDPDLLHSALDISGSVFAFQSHVTFDAQKGSVNATNTTITAATDIQAFAFTRVLMRTAKWIAGETVRVQTRLGCLLGTTCVEAQESDVRGFKNVIVSTAGNNGTVDICGSIQDRVTGGLPSLNGKVGFPYPLSVILDALQCALEGLPPAVIQ